MTQRVMLRIRGRQAYLDQDPDVIELTTEGTLSYRDGGWDIRYEESGLTGMEGVTTEFRVERDRILLTRTGKLNSQMIFRQGVPHESLYQSEFGTLMITVCATQIIAQLDISGGMIDLIYSIEIEHSAVGEVDYHLDILPIS